MYAGGVFGVGSRTSQSQEDGKWGIERLRESEGANRIQLMALRLLSCLAWERLDENSGGCTSSSMSFTRTGGSKVMQTSGMVVLTVHTVG
jgi:hypothetical protein